MDEASKFLEDMTISQPQLPAAYHKISLNPPAVDGTINLVPPLVGLVDQVVNMVTSLIELVDKVVHPIPSSVDPTLSLESVNKVVDLISPLVDPTLPLESKPDTAHVFLVDTESTMLGDIPPSPMEPPPSYEAIHFDWGVLTRPRLPSHIPFQIIV
jgi:hypothetical protein